MVRHKNPRTHIPREVSQTNTEVANKKPGEHLAVNSSVLAQFSGQYFFCSQNTCFLCRSPSEHSTCLPQSHLCVAIREEQEAWAKKNSKKIICKRNASALVEDSYHLGII